MIAAIKTIRTLYRKTWRYTEAYEWAILYLIPFDWQLKFLKGTYSQKAESQISPQSWYWIQTHVYILSNKS